MRHDRAKFKSPLNQVTNIFTKLLANLNLFATTLDLQVIFMLASELVLFTAVHLIYSRIYEDGSLTDEIETFTETGDCEILYCRARK